MRGDTMIFRRRIFISLAVLLLGAGVLTGQDNAGTPLTIGGFTTQGSVTVGYRFDDVKGYRPMYQELLGLNQGFRLMDFNMFGDAPPEPTRSRTVTRYR